MNYTRHELSAAWPDMTAEDLQALRDSVVDSGLREPIVLLDGEVLDGWQRYQACLAEGVKPRFEVFEGDDPINYVRDKHTRRPLNLTQRLTAIALMHRWRQRGRNSLAASCANSAHDVTAADIAKQAGGSVRSAKSVKAAITHGVPEVVAGMKDGSLPAYKAEEIAKLPKEEQPAAVAAPPAPKAQKPRATPVPQAAKESARVVELEEMVVELGQQLADALKQAAAVQAENESVVKILDAGDQLAAAIAEAKKYRELAQGLQERIHSMATQIAELKRSVASWKKKAEAVA